MKNWFLCNFIAGYHIATKFCTRHDNTAVKSCAKFHSNHFTTTWMTAAWNFHQTLIEMEKLFMKWAQAARMTKLEPKSMVPRSIIVVRIFPHTYVCAIINWEIYYIPKSWEAFVWQWRKNPAYFHSHLLYCGSSVTLSFMGISWIEGAATVLSRARGY